VPPSLERHLAGPAPVVLERPSLFLADPCVGDAEVGLVVEPT